MMSERELGEIRGTLDALARSVAESRRERLEWEQRLDERLFGERGAFHRQNARLETVEERHNARLTTLEHDHARTRGALWVVGVVWTAALGVFGLGGR